MKKLSIVLILLILLLVGCSNGGENTSVSPEDSSAAADVQEANDIQEAKSEGYVFEYKGVAIPMHKEAAPILESLGDNMDYFEAESCAFQGMEKVYTYSGFELYTYEADGTDYVAAVIFLDDSVGTKEGIYLYSSLDDILKAYGDNYTEELGLYTYELNKSKISFLIENNEVTSIEYTAVPE